MNTKLNFKVPKKRCEFFFNPKLFKKNGKSNFTDFDTSSVLQINCSNTHRVSLPYGFSATDCQKDII